MSILLQDAENNWYYNAYMGNHVIHALIPGDIDVTNLDVLNPWLKQQGIVDQNWYDFTRSAYIEGDFSAAVNMVAGYEDIPNKMYQKAVNEIEYNPNLFQRTLDNTARAITEDFDASYSPVYNNCGHVAMKWFAMGTMPNSDITYGDQMKWDRALMPRKGMPVYGYSPEFVSPNSMFNFANTYYGKTGTK